MTDLTTIIARLESADGPDRELDAAIAVAIYSDNGHADASDNTRARMPMRTDECAPGTFWIVAFSGMSLRTAPAYTASLDAALTLVPEGAMGWSGDSAVGLMGTYFCDIVTEDDRDFCANAKTEANAITAAALKATLVAKGDG